MKDITIGVDSNITIKVVDRKNNIIEKREVHNKATEAMVDGLLRFLSGEFTPSSLNNYGELGLAGGDAIQYIPTYVGVGNPGLTYSGGTYVYTPESIVEPTFFDTELEKEMYVEGKLERIAVTKNNRINYLNNNNSAGMLLQAYYPAGYSVIDPITLQPYADTFVDESNERATYISEIGLFSGEVGEESLLLARAVFNGEIGVDDNAPIKQTEYSSVIVEWKIGIVSIGEDDNYITEAVSLGE